MTIITLLIPLLPGLAITAALNLGFAEKLALAFVIGWAVHTIIMFLLSLAGVPLIFGTILAADLVFTAILAAFFFRKIDRTSWRPDRLAWPSLFGLALGLLIGVKALLVAWYSFIKPVLDPDIVACYALGAKMIFLNKTVLVQGPWGDKPLMPFLAQAWTAIGPHAWNDTLLTLPNPLFYLCLLVIFYSTLARHLKGWYALLATTLLATVPFLAYQAGTAYTDFTQALYYSLATIYLFLFAKDLGQDGERARASLLAGALLLGLSIWAKRSGLYYAAIDCAAIAIFLWTVRDRLTKEDWKSLCWSALVLAALAAPWLLFNQFSTIQGYSVEAASLAPPPLPPGIMAQSWPIVTALFRNAFMEDNWHLLGLLLAAALAFYPRKALDGRRWFLLLVIALQLACLFAIFRFTGNYRYIFNETLLNRLTFHFVPVILYYCAEVIGAGEAKHLSRPGTEE